METAGEHAAILWHQADDGSSSEGSDETSINSRQPADECQLQAA
jgi:hypothetical protein